MTIRSTPLRTCALLTLAALVTVGGCSGGGGGDADDDSTSTSADAGPLAEFFEEIYAEQMDEDAMRKQQAEYERLIVECMSEAGWEYQPDDGSSVTYSMGDEDYEDTETEEWVAKNGYGFNMVPEESEPDPDATTEEWVDPNADYVEALSETAREAYYETLYGPTIEMTEEESETYEYDWTTSGCQGKASHETWEEGREAPEEFESLVEQMNQVYEDQQSDPKVKELNNEWSHCMADAGHDYATPDDAMNAAIELSNALWNSGYEEAEDPDTYMGPTDEQMAEAREKEIEIALADFTCKQSVNWREEYQKIAFAIEEQFIADHAAELEAYKAAMIEAQNR